MNSSSQCFCASPSTGMASGALPFAISSMASDARGMNRNQLARAIQANFAVIDKWSKGDVEKLDLDVLARICYVLGCDVADLLTYEES